MRSYLLSVSVYLSVCLSPSVSLSLSLSLRLVCSSRERNSAYVIAGAQPHAQAVSCHTSDNDAAASYSADWGKLYCRLGQAILQTGASYRASYTADEGN